MYVLPVDGCCRRLAGWLGADRRPLARSALDELNFGLVVAVADDGVSVLDEVEVRPKATGRLVAENVGNLAILRFKRGVFRHCNSPKLDDRTQPTQDHPHGFAPYPSPTISGGRASSYTTGGYRKGQGE